MDKNIIVRKTCRICNFQLDKKALSLGLIPIVDFVVKDTHPLFSPLSLYLCDKCKLLQLKHEVSRKLLFSNYYWYVSGINKTIQNNLIQIAHQAESIVRLKKNDAVLDIGCNDGTLLRAYKSRNIKLYGFEPAKNLISAARRKTTQIVNDFFDLETCLKFLGNKQFKIITAISMFYDIEDPNKFLAEIKKILTRNGIFIIQQNYLPDMLLNNAFDNIVHEHLEYYSLISLNYLLHKHDLEIFDIKLNSINGGSFQTFIKHINLPYPINQNIQRLIIKEQKLKIDVLETYKRFMLNCKKNAGNLLTFITREVRKGKKIYIYGASTRGNTLLHFCKLNKHLIQGAADKNPMKWGKMINNLGIPVTSEKAVRRIKPDYLLVLPWYFKKEIIKREKNYIKRGGKLIFPLPNFEIYSL